MAVAAAGAGTLVSWSLRRLREGSRAACAGGGPGFAGRETAGREAADRAAAGRETSGCPALTARLWRAVAGENEAAARRRELAAWLDLLLLEVEAGRGLRQAVEEVSPHAGGGMRPVLEAVLRDLGMGATLVEALEARSGTAGLGEEWRAVVRGLRLGQRLGTPVAESLRQLAGDLRRRQRQDLELRLSLLPLKLGLVGLLFFFPPLLVLLVLPNVLQFLRSPW